MIASTMNIKVNAKGRCERDVMVLCSKLYSEYAGALRDNFTEHRPALPGRHGGALGRGVSHDEMGCADFKAVDDEDCKQSRSTL